MKILKASTNNEIFTKMKMKSFLCIYIVLLMSNKASGSVCSGHSCANHNGDDICVENIDMCDGVPRCADCSDENVDNCAVYRTDLSNSHVSCSGDDDTLYNFNVIENNKLCDGNVHCVNGYDEQNRTCAGHSGWSRTPGEVIWQEFNNVVCDDGDSAGDDYVLSNFNAGESPVDCMDNRPDDTTTTTTTYVEEVDANSVTSHKCKFYRNCRTLKYTESAMTYRIFTMPPPVFQCYDFSLTTPDISEDPYELTYTPCYEMTDYESYESGFNNISPVREIFDEILCERAVYAHNWARSKHDNMTRVIWEPVLAASAEFHAMQQADMILNSVSVGTVEYTSNSFYGSGNSYIDITRTFSMEHAVFSWYNDGRKCNYLIERNLRRAGCEIDNFKKVVADGIVEIGCGAAFFELETLPHIIITCHYNTTDSTGVVHPLAAGTQYPPEYEVLSPYTQVEYPENSLGCEGPGRTCWPTYCL